MGAHDHLLGHGLLHGQDLNDIGLGHHAVDVGDVLHHFLQAQLPLLHDHTLAQVVLVRLGLDGIVLHILRHRDALDHLDLQVFRHGGGGLQHGARGQLVGAGLQVQVGVQIPQRNKADPADSAASAAVWPSSGTV